MAVIMRGTLPAQAIGVLILPILARNYDPIAFGHFQLFQSIVNFLLFGASLRLELLILRADDDELEPLLRACLTLNLAFAAIVAAGFAVVQLTQVAAIPFPLILPSLAVAFAGIVQSQSYLLLREERFATLGTLKLKQSVAYATVALALAFVWPTLDGIIIADVVGRAATFAALWRHQIACGHARFVRPASIGNTWKFLVAHRAQPIIALPGVVMNATAAALMPINFFAAYGASVAGQFALVERGLGLPVAMVVFAMLQVYSSRLSALHRARDAGLARFTRRTVTITAAIALVPAVIAWWILPSLFVFVFGPAWAMAGKMAQIMVPAYWLTFAGGSINMTFMTLGHNRLQTGWEFGYLVCMSAVWVAAAVLHLDALGTITAFSIALSLSHVSFIVLALWSTHRMARHNSEMALPAVG
ncbi:MAG: hypothetical protein K2Y20_12855 [Sphingomonas sp.]|nr:hypothetical protein [Sphingomonas sp.]